MRPSMAGGLDGGCIAKGELQGKLRDGPAFSAGLGLIAAALLLIVAFPIAIGLSAVTYYGIDKPLIAWARQVSKRLSAPTVVA